MKIMEMRIAKRLDPTVEKKIYLRDQLVTLGDLQQFRNELINEIKQLITIQHPIPEKKWLKSYEVKNLLKISSGTLQNLRFNGSLNFTKVGGIIYYSCEDIHQMLEGNNCK